MWYETVVNFGVFKQTINSITRGADTPVTIVIIGDDAPGWMMIGWELMKDYIPIIKSVSGETMVVQISSDDLKVLGEIEEGDDEDLGLATQIDLDDDLPYLYGQVGQTEFKIKIIIVV